MHIRNEATSDAAGISSVIERAFSGKSFSSGTEHFIVPALHGAGALTVSLVAARAHEVVGHVAFSPVIISDGAQHWYGLGPLAVEPALHGRGIGSALVKAGLARLRAFGAAGCVVLGEPAYYGRFGFRSVSGLLYPGPPPEYFMAQSFSGALPRGEVAFHAAFAIKPNPSIERTCPGKPGHAAHVKR